LAVGGLIYFTIWPSLMLPWPPSYYGLYSLVMASSFGSGVIALILGRFAQKWLLGIEMFASGILLVLSLLAASTI
jgi:hypothetical protein